MGRVLVHQDQAVGTFGHQVAGPHLPDRAQHGSGVAVGGRHAEHRRRLMHCQLGRGNCRRRGSRREIFGRPVAKRIASVQGGADCSLESAEDRALVAKAHLFLGGMDIDVDQVRVDSNVEHRDRMPSALEPSLAALLERVHQ